MGSSWASVASSAPEDSERLIRQRVRIVLWIIVFSNLFFGLSDVLLPRSELRTLTALKILQLLTVALAFAVLRGQQHQRRGVVTGIAAMAVSSLLTAISGTVTNEVLPSLILALVGNMVTCILIPWGPTPQLIVAAWFGTMVAAEAYNVTGGFSFLSGYIPAAVLVALALPVYMALQMRRGRRQTALANDALRFSEQQFRSLSSSAPIGIFLSDTEGRRIYSNSRWQQITGLDPTAVVGDGWTHSIHPDDYRGVLDRWSECIRSRSEFSYEFRYVRPGGEVRWVRGRAAPLRGDDGLLLGYVGTTEDITERRQTEEELHATQEWLELAVENSNIGVWDWDLATNRTVYSQTWRRQLGYEPGDLQDTWEDWTALVHPEDREKVAHTVVKHLRGGATRYELEIRLRHKDGNYRWVLSRAVILRDSRGNPYRILGLHLDITDRKHSEELLEATNVELRRAMDAAQAANRAKSDFLATMSHEIRTPMNGILGMTGLLLDTPLSVQQRSYADAVRSSANALLGIINDILDFSKVEAGRLELESVDFSVRSVVEESVDLFAESAQRKGLELAVSIAHNVPSKVRGDPGRFRQVLTNLLSNAVKFTERGEIVVRVALTSSDTRGVVIRTAVVDTGIGIRAENLPRLFQAFTQADASTTRRYGGTGLGLAICKRLTELMDGDISATSEPDKGSTFAFTARFQPTPHDMLPLTRDLTGVRILVVDDNATNCTILAEQLTPKGAAVTTANSGSEALAELRRAAGRDPFQLAILDMQMVQMDGLELARSIRRDPALAAPRLILLTSIGDPAEISVLREAGIALCLTKPVHRSSLYDAIATTLAGSTPLADPEPQTRAPVPPRPLGTLARRVLVVEDNAVNQVVAVHLLERLGYRADAVANGLEAIDALAQMPYDAVLMDCLMPEMDGFEATRRIRARQAPHRVPIVALTATAMPGDRERCLAAGMDDYIPKPLHESDLRRVLDHWLGVQNGIGGQAMSIETASGSIGQTSTSSFEYDSSTPGNDNGDAKESGTSAAELLRRFGGDAGLLSAVAEVFIDDSPRLLDEVRDAMARRDAERLKKAAHKLKGALGNFGAGAAVTLTRELERCSDRGDVERAGPTLNPLVAEVESLCSVLRALPRSDG